MGSCASVHKDSKSAMKFRLVFSSKTDKLVSPSPIKDKPLDNDEIKIPDPQLKPQHSLVLPKTSFSDYGSKEETFFDSQAWLESDCDDDFFSVKGDFTPSLGNTPSRGNTPVHRGMLAGNMLGNRTPFVEKPPTSLPQSSPRHKRKNLLELFKESRNRNANEQGAEDNKNGLAADLPKSTLSTPYVPVSSGKRTPTRKFKSEPTSPRSAQCCLPRLRSTGSFRERRKSMSPPAHSVA
ncbi:uncharacterized protein At3g27210-like [Lycium barbarum]|uniref:uncharacterized protein At3g27210-like n=1 Tax=Lycium barbarum TaxID=112863 RepID=UPI00293E09AE|nr:uncharacterized protein At3g27210-like [Lycium barbarum]